MKYQAVFFDVDGVLYDSMPNHVQSWQEAWRSEIQLEVPALDFYLLEGMTGEPIAKKIGEKYLHKQLTPETIKRLIVAKERIYSALPHAPQITGASELMQYLQALKVAICLVTGSAHQGLIDHVAEDFSIDRNFIINARDVTHAKPHPEPYLKAAARVGVEPRQALAVENAPLGVQSARAAGCDCVAIDSGPIPIQPLLDAGAKRVFKDCAELLEDFPSLTEVQAG